MPKYTTSQLKTFETLIENKKFTIESDRAYPQVSNAMQQVLNSGILLPNSSAGSISLIGNSNFLTISGNSISSYLPYFGERQMNIDFSGRDSAIQLLGLMENYTVIKGKNHSISIKFDAKSKLESFKTYIILYPNLKADIQIVGATRSPISYSGKVELLDE
ncbi:DUF4251 domain-containing protein [uncultured Algibacter sp.]|uniref:DUF4251 domain-containing protein n=1 Tax=uncultured Algibacter sp. TaxID=298659 RepID=UPI00262F5AD4|nr:DUF4251 domain-containing protein [uncultured Algibacter sp.]